MAESVDTSDSVASSGDGSSPLGASASSGKPTSPADGERLPPPASSNDAAAAQSSGWQGRVDFYILEGPSAAARLKLACKLAEKAYLSSQSVLVWHTDPTELKAFDDMLWTFSDGSFIPHEPLTATVAPHDAPVLLSAGTPPSANVDIIINLAPDLPPCLSHTRRVAEIIDGDEARRRAGRARFKAYRELGVQPASHNIRSE
ncbi:MAG: polymerase chi subunit HolC [Gammaproteobacteria bacterium]|jgi:DNA polymerase-3 subunit chi|nr:polymerase chi subunit HolC [Gammaproteobacteria bacterium]